MNAIQPIRGQEYFSSYIKGILCGGWGCVCVVFLCVCAFVKGVNRGHTSDSAKGNVGTLPTGDVPICALPA